MAVQRYRRAGLELDEVEHRALAEERPSRDTLGQLERTDIVEAHEDGFHAMTLPRSAVKSGPEA